MGRVVGPLRVKTGSTGNPSARGPRPVIDQLIRAQSGTRSEGIQSSLSQTGSDTSAILCTRLNLSESLLENDGARDDGVQRLASGLPQGRGGPEAVRQVRLYDLRCGGIP